MMQPMMGPSMVPIPPIIEAKSISAAQFKLNALPGWTKG